MATKQTQTQAQPRIPVVVGTSLKGVFFGYGSDITLHSHGTITLEEAQMCVLYHSSIRGFMGLASRGPNNQCRVSWPVPAITLNGVTSIVECTQEAVDSWKKAPW